MNTDKVFLNTVEAYNEGFIQGVKHCERYGIPENPLQTTPTSLFTTEDGKEIKMGEEYWGIWIDKPEKWVANKYCVENDKGMKRFSTKEAANDYLLKLKL